MHCKVGEEVAVPSHHSEKHNSRTQKQAPSFLFYSKSKIGGWN